MSDGDENLIKWKL